MSKTFTFFLLITFMMQSKLSAQGALHLSIQEAISMAEEQSIEAFRNKNTYLADYWKYKNYKALFLPSLNFNANLVDYQQGNTREFNRLTNSYDYVARQDLTTAIGLNIAQNIPLTGGTLKLNYDIDRLDNFGDNSYYQFSSTPFRISYKQTVFGYNAFKWLNKTSPLEFEKAKKEYLYNTEQMHRLVVQYFFNLAQAQNNKAIAKQKHENAQYRYQMGQKKYELGIMKKVDVLDLEVSLRNAEVQYNQANIYEQRALMTLNSNLKLPPNTPIELVFDYNVPKVILNENNILERAITNNPEMIDYKLDVLYAESLLEKAKREKGLAFDLVAGYGLSKIDGGYNATSASFNNGNINAMFRPPFDRYSQATIGINMPIVDWGRRRGTYKIRKAEYEISESEYEQDLANFKQQILIMVRQFNLLPQNIEAAAIADQAAQESYTIYDKYFKKGEAELINLINSINQRDNARRDYLNTLYDYWYSYYDMRVYTLYDFIEGRDLEADFDKLVKN